MARDEGDETLTAERVGEPTSLVDQKAASAPITFRDRLIRSRAPEIVDAVAAVVARRRQWPSAYWLTLFAFVVAPALAVCLYFAFLASDQFAVETRFAVSATRNDVFSEKVMSVASSSSYIAAGQDAYIVSGYIHSRAIVDDLSKIVDVRAMFSRPEADFWARLKSNATSEELTDYWRGMVDSYVDGPSGIVTVTVRAFRREDALAIAKAVVAVSEILVNEVSAHARADAIKLAEAEVGSAEGRVVSSLTDLRAFRDKAGFIDPTKQATAAGALLTELLSKKIKLQTEYFVATRAMSPEAPTLQSLKSRLEALDQQIAEQKAELTNADEGAKSLASLLPKFEELELRHRLAEKLYGLAQDGLERARLRGESRSLYVTVFVPPAEPQEARFPERVSLSLVISGALFVLWGICALTAAIIEDHRI
jgi:capsular polysaccharide transport system permease protein